MYEGEDDREEVIRKYKYDFDYEKFPNKAKSEVCKLAGKRLGCFCKPQACHGDVLVDFLNSWDDGKSALNKTLLSDKVYTMLQIYRRVRRYVFRNYHNTPYFLTPRF